jgi:hypothetical protein
MAVAKKTATTEAKVDEGRTFRVRLTLTEEMLGTAPNNEAIYTDFIASKAPDAASAKEEIEMIGVEEYADKQTTVFRRNRQGEPILLDYMIKGFFKNSCSALREVSGTKSSKLTAYKKKIDGLIFILERQIDLIFPEDDDRIDICERPLRASTAQGDRVALASSETVPAGTTLEFTIKCFSSALYPMVVEWLDYGAFNGLGQWHNSGKGRFTWELVEEY